MSLTTLYYSQVFGGPFTSKIFHSSTYALSAVITFVQRFLSLLHLYIWFCVFFTALRHATKQNDSCLSPPPSKNGFLGLAQSILHWLSDAAFKKTFAAFTYV